MIIVLLDPMLPSCQRFLQQHGDLPCRKWNVRHPVVKRYLDRSSRARAIQSLPTVIEINGSTGEVVFYTHEQAFIHAQAVRESGLSGSSVVSAPLAGSVVSAPSVVSAISTVSAPSASSFRDIPGAEQLIDLDASEPAARLIMSDSELREAEQRKPRDATASELAAQMRLAREELESSSAPAKSRDTSTDATNLRPPMLSVTEILGSHAGLRNPDPPGLGMDPRQ